MPISTLHFRDILHAVKLRHGTDGGKRAEDFFRPKNPTAWAGCEPANLGTKGQHATSRPPKPICYKILLTGRMKNNNDGRPQNVQ